MTATVPEMTVEKLTDDAIAKRIRAIDRLVATRKANIDDLQAEIIGFQRERAVLIQAQIDRLQAQLPADDLRRKMVETVEKAVFND